MNDNVKTTDIPKIVTHTGSFRVPDLSTSPPPEPTLDQEIESSVSIDQTKQLPKQEQTRGNK